MIDLSKIKNALSDHFGAVVTIKKLESPNGSKTVSRAKSIGAYIAHKNDYSNGDIASAFGYKTEKSASRVHLQVGRDINNDAELKRDVDTIENSLF